MSRSEGSTDRESSTRRLPAVLADPQIRVALVAAVALIVQAVLAKNVLHVELDVFSLTAALWVFVVYQIGGWRSRAAELGFVVVIIAVTAAVLGLYARG